MPPKIRRPAMGAAIVDQRLRIALSLQRAPPAACVGETCDGMPHVERVFRQTAEIAGAAATVLADRLAPQRALSRSVDTVGGSEFFARDALLYLSPQGRAARLGKLSAAAPLIRTLASDQAKG
jgi:hypothetical protein